MKNNGTENGKQYKPLKKIYLIGGTMGGHIALFFVDSNYQRQGIGKKLFSLVSEDNTGGSITVNSSPFAVPIYHRLGFVDTNSERVTNGLRYTPMMINLKNQSVNVLRKREDI